MREYKLKHTLKTATGEFSVLHFDFDKLTFSDMRNVATIRKMYDTADLMMEPRTDFGFCVATAWMAAVKGTPGLMVQDVVSLHIEDVLQIHDIAQDDCFFRAAEDPPEPEKINDGA